MQNIWQFLKKLNTELSYDLSDYYSVRKRSKCWDTLQHRWTSKNIREKSQTQKVTKWFSVYEVPQTGKFLETERRLVVGGKMGKRGATAQRVWVSFWGDGGVLGWWRCFGVMEVFWGDGSVLGWWRCFGTRQRWQLHNIVSVLMPLKCSVWNS